MATPLPYYRTCRQSKDGEGIVRTSAVDIVRQPPYSSSPILNVAVAETVAKDYTLGRINSADLLSRSKQLAKTVNDTYDSNNKMLKKALQPPEGEDHHHHTLSDYEYAVMSSSNALPVRNYIHINEAVASQDVQKAARLAEEAKLQQEEAAAAAAQAKAEDREHEINLARARRSDAEGIVKDCNLCCHDNEFEAFRNAVTKAHSAVKTSE
ncbi:hypothetical protein O3P69_010474 [Scylla paramamosain]|uniref:Uncharacterized protein n=1 Tax=Scylla paramamosain TaxID=85552 RepID=A0AAW0TU21_SCYPA